MSDNNTSLALISLPAPGGGRTRETARKLGRTHFVFLRGLIQGMDAADLWRRYLDLEGRYHPQRAERIVLEMKTAFAAAARRHGRHGVAKLLLFDTAKLSLRRRRAAAEEGAAAEQGRAGTALVSPVMSFEAFAAKYASFYREKELVTEYERAYGKQSALHDREDDRRARFMQKQLEALNWLESVAAEPARSGHLLAAWLRPREAQGLNAKGIHTLGELIARINGLGHTWWRGIEAVGAQKGARIVEWLRARERELGQKVLPHVDVPRRRLQREELANITAYATAVVPLDKLLVPTQLDGSNGAYRVPKAQCLIAAKTDLDAVYAYLRAITSKHTQRAYRKELERVVLWAIVQQQKPISSLTVEDCLAYREFLTDPQPADQWTGPRARERWSGLWRPFEGPLSERSERHALTILRSFWQWLNDQNYLLGNPWRAVPSRQKLQPKINIGRSFTQKQWQFLIENLDRLEEGGAARRLRFVLNCFYATGLRLTELANGKCDDLKREMLEEGEEGWMHTVFGKGGKVREVPWPDALVEELKALLAARGLDPDPEAPSNAGVYLIGKIDDANDEGRKLRKEFSPREGIAEATLYQILKDYFTRASQWMKLYDEKSAARLARASTHWLRHTHASHALAAQAPPEVVQNNLGHASLGTTTIYLTTEKSRRHRGLRKFWEKTGAG